MASIYKRPNSPFYWVKYRDHETGNICRESTKFRTGVGHERRLALNYAATLALKETKSSAPAKQERFDTWVESFLPLRYSGPTLERVRVAWMRMGDYLRAKGVHSPRHVRRTHCLDYISDRSKEVMMSTAILELRYFSAIMTEAVRRDFIDANPCRNLGVKAPKAKPKAEITDPEIAIIRREIARVNENEAVLAAFRKLRTTEGWSAHEFLEASFEIAIHQGCRLSETLIDLWRDVDLENEEISFHAKGDRFYTTALNPTLRWFVEQWRKEGRMMSYRTPSNMPLSEWRKLASWYWAKFFDLIGLPHLSFHCTRVTCVSRLHRAGAPESTVMQLVNHASSTVHRIYRRTKRHELKAFWPSFSPASGTLQPPEKTDSPAAIPERIPE